MCIANYKGGVTYFILAYRHLVVYTMLRSTIVNVFVLLLFSVHSMAHHACDRLC